MIHEISEAEFFNANSKRVRPAETEADRDIRRTRVVEAWRAEGIKRSM